jgi:hypothetical protein
VGAGEEALHALQMTLEKEVAKAEFAKDVHHK